LTTQGGTAYLPLAVVTENANHFHFEQPELTRRQFIRLGAVGAAALGYHPLAANARPAPQLAKAIAALEPYFTQIPFLNGGIAKRPCK